jgi:putative transposase
MPNHVHLIAVPKSADGLRRAIGEAHRCYTRMVNFRERWRGHLWQGRFASFVLDESYLLTGVRYVELNPERAGLIIAPSRYRWSSAAAHVRGQDDALVRVAPLLRLAPPWRGFLARVIRQRGHQTPPCPRAHWPASR